MYRGGLYTSPDPGWYPRWGVDNRLGRWSIRLLAYTSIGLLVDTFLVVRVTGYLSLWRLC